MELRDEPGELRAIWLKRVRLGPMDAVSNARLRAGRGLVGNADQGRRRQVTLISAESWAAVERQLGATLDPSLRRANLLISGLDLRASRGRILRLGPCRLRIGGETRPCRRMDEQHPGLQRALDPDWRGGVWAEVLDDGDITVGDPVSWDEAVRG